MTLCGQAEKVGVTARDVGHVGGVILGEGNHVPQAGKQQGTEDSLPRWSSPACVLRPWAMLRRCGSGNNRGELSSAKIVPEQRRKLSRQEKTWSTRGQLIQEGHTEASTWLSGHLTLQTT